MLLKVTPKALEGMIVRTIQNRYFDHVASVPLSTFLGPFYFFRGASGAAPR